MRLFDRESPSPSEAISSAFDFLEIIERLAHAHHHDIGDLAALGGHHGAVGRVLVREIAKPVACGQKLRQNFFRREVAHQLLRTGMAEGAGERAANLRGNAQRAAAFLGDVDAFDLDRAARAGGKRNSHLRVPSCEICSSTTSGRAMVNCSARRPRRSLEMLRMSAKSETPRT